MENNLENKARFFAQYFGQNVLSLEFNNSIYNEVLPCIPYNWNGQENNCSLELKPLSSITDEELLTAIKILDSDDEFTELGSLQIGREILQIVENIKTKVARNDIHPQYIFHFADYLRSKGYALPWMGLSVDKLQEYGWVKLKSE